MDFLDEIWIQIIFELQCIYIINVSCVSKYFRDLCEKENLFKRRKYKGFPRLNGHCKAHDTSKYYNKDDKALRRSESHELILLSISSGETLNGLIEDNCDLVRGDLICFCGFLHRYIHAGIFIFDGYKIIPLGHEVSEYGDLPNEFTVINDNVPINYWNNDNEKGIEAKLIWFDHKSVKNQCMDNIKCENNEVYTEFVFDGKSYKIICRGHHDLQYKIEELIEDLSTNENLELFYDDENILYLDIY